MCKTNFLLQIFVKEKDGLPGKLKTKIEQGIAEMYCPFCGLSFDGPDDGGQYPDCGAKYDYTGQWTKGKVTDDDGDHETGSDATEGDFLLDQADD